MERLLCGNYTVNTEKQTSAQVWDTFLSLSAGLSVDERRVEIRPQSGPGEVKRRRGTLEDSLELLEGHRKGPKSKVPDLAGTSVQPCCSCNNVSPRTSWHFEPESGERRLRIMLIISQDVILGPSATAAGHTAIPARALERRRASCGDCRRFLLLSHIYFCLMMENSWNHQKHPI